MEIDRNGLEVLDRTTCLHLLGRATLGRIAITSGALPSVVPVNFWLDGDRIVISTVAGSKLDSAARNAVVAFEVDDFDGLYHSGWSVVVTGRSREVVDPIELQALRWAPVPHWVVAGDHVVTITTDIISGRRILAPPARRPAGQRP